MKFEKRIHFYSPCGNDYISTQELYALGKIIRTDAGVEYLTPCCMVSDNPGQSGMLLFISKIDALVYAKNRLIEEDEELNLYDFKDINVTELMMNMPIFEGGLSPI